MDNSARQAKHQASLPAVDAVGGAGFLLGAELGQLNQLVVKGLGVRDGQTSQANACLLDGLLQRAIGA